MVEITCENRNVKRPIDLKEIKKTAGKVLHYLGKRGFGLNIVFVSNQKIRALNRKYLARDNATDCYSISGRRFYCGRVERTRFSR